MGGEQLTIWGAHEINDLGDGRSDGAGDIDYFLIGDTLCSKIDVDQDEDSWNKNYRSELLCNSYIHQEAGEYSFTELVTPGYAQLSLRTQQTSLFTGKNYTQRVAPKITEMNYHEGGVLGQRIRVTGSGFSNNPVDFSCQVAG